KPRTRRVPPELCHLPTARAPLVALEPCGLLGCRSNPRAPHRRYGTTCRACCASTWSLPWDWWWRHLPPSVERGRPIPHGRELRARPLGSCSDLPGRDAPPPCTSPGDARSDDKRPRFLRRRTRTAAESSEPFPHHDLRDLDYRSLCPRRAATSPCTTLAAE